MTTTSTRQLRPAVAGDVNDVRTLTLNGIEDLDGLDSIEGHVQPVSGGASETLAVTVTDSATATVTLSLGGVAGWLADATPGTYRIDVEATFLDGTVLTWPADAPLGLRVRAELDPEES